MFETDPGDKGGAEGEVEEPFVGDGEDDEGGGESEKDDYEPLEVVVVITKFVDEGKGERGDQSEPSDDLTAQGKTLLGLKRGNTGACDDDCEEDQSDLNAHDKPRDKV